MLQNVCLPELRATAFALYALTDDIGKGLGPVVVVELIDHFAGDRQKAFNVVICGWVLCGAMLGMLVCTVRENEAKVQVWIEQSMRKHHHSQV